jgi:hypothetical protein
MAAPTPPHADAHTVEPGYAHFVSGAVSVALAAIILFAHGYECLDRFPTGARTDRDLPFTQDDHPFHFYYAQLSAEIFARRGAFWGYDPTFMAGYAKTLIFPTSSTMVELSAIGGARSAFAYRLLVAGTMFFTPLLLGLAARSVARGPWSFLAALSLGVVWIWCGFPSTYAEWGMGPFILASAASVWGGLVLAGWLDEPSPVRIVGGGIIATLATIAHPSSSVILTLMLLPAYAVRARSLSWKGHLAAWCVPATVILVWSPWWLPAFILRDTFGTTASGFINENIWGRMQELAEAQFPEATSLLLLAFSAVAPLRGFGRAQFWSMVGGAVLLFLLAYFGSAIRIAWALQHGRYTQPLYALLIVLVTAGTCRVVQRLRAQPRTASVWVCVALLGGCSLVAVRVTGPKVLAYWRARPIPGVNADLPRPVVELAECLRAHVDSSGRVLFEDHGRLALDPFEGRNPAALLPLQVPGQYIGGPYLYTHLKSNFTQFGDGKLFEHPVDDFDRAMFESYARLYNIRWCVFWTPPMVVLAERHPDLFRRLSTFGLLRVYELVREPSWAITGTARVEAHPDRIEVHDAQPDATGTLVLSYHWIRTLRSTATLRPVLLKDDPVPFIAVDSAPTEFVIENRLW